MGTRSFLLYACLLLGILTSLTPSSPAAVEVPHSVQKAESGSTPSSQVKGSQSPGGADHTMTSVELVRQLKQPEAAVKNHILVLKDKTITGDLQLGGTQLTVPFQVDFSDCEFQNKVAVKNVIFNRNVRFNNVIFDKSVVFNNVIFDKAFRFEYDHVKGDLQLDHVQVLHTQDLSSSGKPYPPAIHLNQTRVDGDLRIKEPRADVLEAENLAAGNVIVGLAKSGISQIKFAKLDTGRLSISGDSCAKPDNLPGVEALDLSGSGIHETLTIQNLTFQTVLAANLTVAKRMQFLPRTLIAKRLDLSFSSLASFDWQFPGDDHDWLRTTSARSTGQTQPSKAVSSRIDQDRVPFRLPENVNIEGATFSTLHMAPSFPGNASSDKDRENSDKAKCDEESKNSSKAKSDEESKTSDKAKSDEESKKSWLAKQTDYGLTFLEKAAYSEPAYSAYEASLKTQGRTDAADHVYFAMRDRRRYTDWHEACTASSGRTLAGVDYVIGFVHKWLFGYGRSWVYPIVWCVAFIVAGIFVFRDVALMEKQDDKPAHPFSSLWYSVDLFVPVLTLGVASRWSPKSDQRLRLFYAKLLKLAGAVFLAAVLGALTGSLK